MIREEITVVPEYFSRYTNLIPADMEIREALKTYGGQYIRPEVTKYKELGEQIYAPGKWTVKQTLIHISDAERVFQYRALRFARGDQSPLMGFEQDSYVANASVAGRTVDDIIEELITVRQSTIALFDSLGEDILPKTGTASGSPVSVLALGFMACGHLVHHQNIFRDKYYPLLG